VKSDGEQRERTWFPCATRKLEGGAGIRFIQQQFGYEKLEPTAIYPEVTLCQ